MKRMHLHVGVPDLARAIDFYAALFGAPPAVVKPDYAKWMLEDPKVNFAISQRGAGVGVDHVGIQAESRAELAEVAGRLKAAGERTFDEAAVTCCYAKGDKSWTNDPAGVRWETFFTYGEATDYGEDAGAETTEAAAEAPGSCCAARSPQLTACC
jgi:catechol 2,3-dioxygenase-like lactoylglutathione lyase family enzyme